MPVYSTIEPVAPKPAGAADERIRLRPEQEEAVADALKYFTRHRRQPRYLWNAKMRFGKTICALELARRMGTLTGDARVRRTIIVTHRPVVNDSWRADFTKVFGADCTSCAYGTKFDDSAEGDFYALNRAVRADDARSFIFFASMQYLRRSTAVGGTDDEALKRDILAAEWDLVVVDEAHEGTRTDLGHRVIEQLTQHERTRALHLSGTPFNLYEAFTDDQIFTWDFIREQRAKRAWPSEHPDQPAAANPYRELPDMEIRTFDLGRLIRSDLGEGATFQFSEFFRTRQGTKVPPAERGRFVHEADVRRFLDLLCTDSAESHYPFSTPDYRDSFNHTLWVVPGVKEARALEQLLSEHEVFGEFDAIVNVAGNGDADEARTDALDKVRRAIGAVPEQTHTITLSCGRLTTGVTVRPWTAVFYLKGSDNTSAATYMQTIFRVQSPYTYTAPDGRLRMKTKCYVFDFAPDRTLRMVAETAKFATITQRQKRSASLAGSHEQDMENMSEFLRYCPVIAMQGGQMVEYHAEHLFEQLNRVYVDRVVRNGFNDNSLYNLQALMQLAPDEVDDLNHMADEIAKSTNMEKPKKASADVVPVAEAGMDQKKEEALKRAKEKIKEGKPLTAEEQQAKREAEERRKRERQERDKRITILRGMSLRIPLLMYGAQLDNEDEGITIDNFTRLIDQASWDEFMPRGITKAQFNRFRKCYNASVFVAAGKRYRQLAREADRMHVDERMRRISDIFACFHNPDKETVLTPWRVVNMHLSDCLGGYAFFNERFDGPVEREVEATGGELFEWVETDEPRFVDRDDVTRDVFDTHNRILEINSKTGLYPLYVAYAFFRRRLADYVAAELLDDPANLSVEEEQVVWDDVLTRNVYVICNTPLARRITERTLLGFRRLNDRNGRSRLNIQSVQLIRRAADDREALIRDLRSEAFWCGDKRNKNMINFGAVVGNPPYQVMDKGNGNGAAPIYHTFIDIARAISLQGTLIHPARFLFNAGKTPKEWNRAFLSDPHVKVIDYWANSMEVFPTVDVKGGIAVTYWNRNKDFGTIGFFTAYDELRSILHKVQDKHEKSISEIVSPRELYSLTDELYKEHPEMEGRQSKGHKYSLGANVFNVFPELFEEDSDSVNKEGKAKVYGRSGNRRCFKWIKASYISHPDNFGFYKVILPKANGSGAIGEVLSTPIIGTPIIGYTDTFLGIGCYKKEKEVEACLKYVKTKFARTMLGTLKTTQDNPREAWSNVPIQEFTPPQQGGIDWSQSVADIDRQLYKKYGLSADEIAFIEKMIKPME